MKNYVAVFFVLSLLMALFILPNSSEWKSICQAGHTDKQEDGGSGPP